MKFYLKYSNSQKKISLDYEKKSTMSEIKADILLKNEDIKHIDQLKFIYGGKVLSNKDTLLDIELKENTTILVMILKKKKKRKIKITEQKTTPSPQPLPNIAQLLQQTMPILGNALPNTHFIQQIVHQISGSITEQIDQITNVMEVLNISNNETPITPTSTNISPVGTDETGEIGESGESSQPLIEEPDIPPPSPSFDPLQNVIEPIYNLLIETGSLNNNYNTHMNQLREQYQDQLQIIHSMGFTNEMNNIQALQLVDGDTEKAINLLLSMN